MLRYCECYGCEKQFQTVFAAYEKRKSSELQKTTIVNSALKSKLVDDKGLPKLTKMSRLVLTMNEYENNIGTVIAIAWKYFV